MGLTAITNAQIVTPNKIIKDGVILIEESNIVAIGEKDEIAISSHHEIVNANGLFVGPGFIDIHNHGGGGHWAHEEPLEFAKSHLKFGTTGVLPTLAYFLSKDELLTAVNKVIDVKNHEKNFHDLILGIHLEGPFLNPKYGAITTEIRKVDRKEYEKLLKIAGNEIKIWTLAPELEGQKEFMEVASQYKNIVFSVGHSEATPEQIHSFIPKGLKLACHFSNASGITPSPSRFGGTREVGLDEAVLLYDDITAEVIPDRAGIHVRSLMLQLLVKVKGVDHVIIITDAMKEAGIDMDMSAQPKSLKGFKNYGDLNFTDDGELNGSRLTMDRAVANMMKHTSIDIISAFKMAATNPAKLIGVDHMMGSIEVGKRANLLIVDEDITIHHVIYKGKQVI